MQGIKKAQLKKMIIECKVTKKYLMRFQQNDGTRGRDFYIVLNV